MEYFRDELSAWENECNSRQTKVNWQFKTKDVRIKPVFLYPDL